MRNIGFTIISILLLGCSPRSQTQPDIVSSFEKNKRSQMPSGIWISEVYYNDIIKNKNPKNSQELSQLSLIEFPNENHNDVLLIWNFHEGTDGEIKYENGIYLLNGSPLKIDVDKLYYNDYCLIKTSINDLNNILENLIFKGTYKLNDKKVVLTENGEIEGLENYSYFQPIIDYFDAGMQVNQIRIKKPNKDFEYFGFDFIKDTLAIYDLNCLTFDSVNHNCVEVELGVLKYKLIKEK